MDEAFAIFQKALSGSALGSIVPSIGTMAGAPGGIGAEALVDWLRGFLTTPDIDLLLDPAKKLADDFLAEVAQAANTGRARRISFTRN